MRPAGPRDDRLLPETRWAALVVTAILIPALVILWGLPVFVGAAVFYGWVGVYIVSPIAVGWLWLRNSRTDPGAAEPGDPAVPAGARRFARALGAATIAAGLLFLIAPAVAIDVWPWALTPLTARVIACFTIQVGIGAMLLSADARWSSWRLLLQTFLVATALLLAGAVRAWDDFEGAGA